MKWLSRASRTAVRFAQPLVRSHRGGISILTYHLVGAGTESPVDLPLDSFRQQLNELRECAEICSLADAIGHLEAGTADTRPFVVITFDDGFDNFRTSAWPLLKELQLPCTFYVPVGFIEGAFGTPLKGAEGLPPIEWTSLRELASDPLLTVGSHSWCHRDLRTLSPHELRVDLQRSHDQLEVRIGAPVEHFCYPQAKWSRAVETQVAAIYRTAVVAGGYRNLPGRFHPLRLGRIPIRRDMRTRLHTVLRSTIWLEEFAASYARSIM